MYVCICNAVTDSDIRNAVDDGVRNFKQLSRATDCGKSCGCCKEMAVDILQQTLINNRKSRHQGLLPVMQPA
jgi:bacterioferritin-associated ferredoxin